METLERHIPDERILKRDTKVSRILKEIDEGRPWVDHISFPHIVAPINLTTWTVPMGSFKYGTEDTPLMQPSWPWNAGDGRQLLPVKSS